ncbi:MAG: copper resistance protein NlpE [Clostridia bacterium]|nr:copper resistance protein NlpE [Clostridia bacterium]
MKKTLVLLTALLALLVMLAPHALAAPASADVIGTWYLNEMNMGGAPLNPSDFGMEMTLILNEDNTAVMQMTDEEDEVGTWEIADGQIVLAQDEGETIVFSFIDGNLVVEKEGMAMILGREKAEKEAFEIAPVRTDAALADFAGQWNLHIMEANGQMVPAAAAAAFGFDISLAIDGNDVVMVMFGMEQAMEGDVSEGVLVATIEDEGETVFISFYLHEDDILSCNLDEDTLLYFIKAE